ncbi:MAG TPA: hypothetical protein VHX38_10015 [Pseudonocardiaceae bacterium]|nr:hypothetical protein [Pseudonocardiaceae bacterium]
MVATVVVGVLWTSVLLVAEFVRGIRQRHRIDLIARRIDELMGTEQATSGRHRSRGARHV